MPLNKRSLFLVAISILVAMPVFSQENQIIHLNNQVYRYVKLLQQRGHLAELNPTKLPYNRGEVIESLRTMEKEGLGSSERFWVDSIEEELGYDNSENKNDFYLHGLFEPGIDMNNTIGKEGIRPQADKAYFLPYAPLRLYMEKSGLAAQLGGSHNLFNYYDRRGESAQSRIYLRSEDFYVGYRNSFIFVYAGRYKHLWAPHGETSVLLGTNAHSFNNLDITLGNDRFKVTGFFGELENISENGSFEGFGARDGIQRYLALHRIDVKITEKLRIGYFDGFLYSGKSVSPRLNYLVPTNFFHFERANNPDDDQFNYFFGGFIWGQIGKITTNFQLMLDDIVINNPDPAIVEKPTFAITHSIYAAALFDNIDLGYESEFISYQTYNTDQAEGRYLYLNRGIANQFTDYIFFKTYLNIHAHQWVRGLTITPSIQYLLQGEQEINQTFVGTFEPIDIILTGTEEKTSRFELASFYNPVPWFWLDSRLGYNYTNDINHIPGNTDSRFTYRFELGLRFKLDGYSDK